MGDLFGPGWLWIPTHADRLVLVEAIAAFRARARMDRDQIERAAHAFAHERAGRRETCR